MRRLHLTTLDILPRHLPHSKTHDTDMAVERPLIKEVLPNTPLQPQPLPFSWCLQLASSGHSNRPHKLPQLRVPTQHLRVECL
jgi:hypothetical protein